MAWPRIFGALPAGNNPASYFDDNFNQASPNGMLWTAYVPTVTLVGGSGNTVPVYATNFARYMQIGKMVFVEFNLANDGGAEGAGTGILNIALPVTAGANANNGYKTAGRYVNNALRNPLLVQITPSTATFTLAFITSAAAQTVVTGDDQNNTTRGLSGSFFYEVD